MNTLFEAVKQCSLSIDDNRTIGDVLIHTVTEVGELATEVQVVEGKTYKSAGEDGVIGEAIDLIICALDMIVVTDSTITEQQVIDMASRKLLKWKNSCTIAQ